MVKQLVCSNQKKKKKPTKTGHVGELRESINIGKHTCIKLSVANF